MDPSNESLQVHEKTALLELGDEVPAARNGARDLPGVYGLGCPSDLQIIPDK
jgi:hypothetical protein